jgi:hypothetical protein
MSRLRMHPKTILLHRFDRKLDRRRDLLLVPCQWPLANMCPSARNLTPNKRTSRANNNDLSENTGFELEELAEIYMRRGVDRGACAVGCTTPDDERCLGRPCSR